MKTATLTGVMVLAAFLLGSATISLACQAAGENKHVGNVMSIDAKAESFTIRDAETGEPMTFNATAALLEGFSVRDRVVVSYKEEDGAMIAVEVDS